MHQIFLLMSILYKNLKKKFLEQFIRIFLPIASPFISIFQTLFRKGFAISSEKKMDFWKIPLDSETEQKCAYDLSNKLVLDVLINWAHQ